MNNMNLRSPLAFFSSLFRRLNPTPPVGAVAFGDTAIRFLLIDAKGKMQKASLRLPPGIIERGTVKDERALIEALKNIRAQAGKAGIPLHVILSLPPGMVYAQPFSVPPLPEGKIAEAASLNLQMISPIEFSSAYAAYEKIGEAPGGGTDMLGAFVEKEKVEQFSRILNAAGFAAAAVEFPSLALARLAKYDRTLLADRAYIMLDIGGDGVSFMIIRGLNLYFYAFRAWAEVKEGGGEIRREDFETFIKREIQKLMNFHGSRWGGAVSELIISSEGADKALEKELSAHLKLPVRMLAIPDFAVLGSGWLPVLGSALRGVVSRAEDTFLSLTDASAEKQYREARMLHFLTLWRKAAITVGVFILVLFVVADSFIARMSVHVGRALETDAPGVTLAEVRVLEAKAKEFNQLVRTIAAANAEDFGWEAGIQRISELAGSGVQIRTIRWNGRDGTLNGTAADADALIVFKKKFTEDPLFEKVDLPITKVVDNPDESLNFTATFSLKKI